MRIEPYDVDSYTHVLKRGARGMPITSDDADRYRFLKILYHMNDEHLDHDWDVVHATKPFERFATWPERKPLVLILGFTLMPNHIHLILKEIRKCGISQFMQKVGQSMSNHFNHKYDKHGSLFQGSYRSRTIDGDVYLRYVSAYVMVKNVFELYPKGGLRRAIENFNDAWEWSIKYPFSSLCAYAGGEGSPIIEKELLGEIFRTPKEFKEFARDVIMGGTWTLSELE